MEYLKRVVLHGQRSRAPDSKSSSINRGVGGVEFSLRWHRSNLPSIFFLTRPRFGLRSGNKPDIDNTYFVYNTGNDGLYHLALVEDPEWGVEAEDVLGMREEDLKRLQARQLAKSVKSMGSMPPTPNPAVMAKK